MKLSRRRFVQLSSVTLAGIPFSQLTANEGWYENPEALAEAALYETFKNPVGTAKPYVRWWWNGLRVVKEELLRELDMLKELGIGGVEINSIRFPETADPMGFKELEWLSEEWIEMLGFAVKAAKERGIVCDIIMGSGWPFGGEFLTKDEQTQIMALGTKDIKGPQTFQITRAEIEQLVEPPIASKHDKRYKELSALRLAPAKLTGLDTVVDLDAEIGKDAITIQIPEGDYVLYFLVRITGFMAVMYGAPGASGPVLNHYNKEAVQKYLSRMSDAIVPKLGVIGENFRSVFTDSLELEGANWCDDMYSEFQKRRKYALKPYLPFILFKTGRLGRAILTEKYGSIPEGDLVDTLERVRYDFELTKMELFQERFLDSFLDWCKKNKVLSRVQAYGREYHPLESSMQVDIPECETWIRRHTGEVPKEFDYSHGRTYSEVNKFVSSGARLAGKKMISCEEITNTQLVFNATLENVKITGDQSNLSGVSHSILHGFNYSPPKAAFPGWVRYGTLFNERNPWWPYLKNWVAYKSRLSAVFQQGTLMSDIAVMHPLPDLWGKFAAQWDPFPERAWPDYVHNVWEAIHQCGGGCDYLSENILQKASFKEGKLKYGPRSYKILLIIEAETMYPETVKALDRFAAAGGKIVFVGKEPYKAPGYYDHEAGDKEVSKIVAGLKKRTGVALYPSPDNSLYV
ncbi:glycosyl hydrolase [Pedobacter heparinus]|uniref:glycosyl hydrolase n=1 Tax=Pedobacter heparinus TaxID=984 RepID=UPI00293022EB|nr:glycosyl hydrolase [Pedobacter heparinus]